MFLIIEKNSSRMFTLLLVFIIFKLKPRNTHFPQMIENVKRRHLHHSGEKIWMVKNPEFLADYRTIPVIPPCKILARSDKVSVWVEYLKSRMKM